MAHGTRVVVIALAMLLGAAGQADAAEVPLWRCADRMPVYLHAPSGEVLRNVDAALARLSTATGRRWFVAGITSHDPSSERRDASWPARIITSTNNLAKDWRGLTVRWATSTEIVAADVIVNGHRAIGDAEVLRVLLHELAHVAGVTEHSSDPHSPLYSGSARLPASKYTAEDAARLRDVRCRG